MRLPLGQQEKEKRERVGGAGVADAEHTYA